MAGRPVGTAFAELNLDATPMERGLKRVHDQLISGSIKVEDSYKSLGIKSDAVYEQMRKNATAAVDFIKNKTISSKEEIVRAEQAAAAKIKQINEQQFGAHASFLDKMKANYIATAAVIVAAWVAIGKAKEYAEIGAKALQTEESFRIVAASANESADKIISGMRRAAQGTVDDSDIMQKAVKGMVLGLKGEEMIHIMEAARVSARVAGESVKEAYESITNSIATGMPRALKKYGLATKEETAIVEQALKAGVEGINLYTLAMMNAGIQSAKFGALQANAAEGLQVSKAQFQELTETIGKFVIELGTRAFAVVKTFAGMLTFMAAPIAYLIGGTEAYNAMIASGNDLLKQSGALVGHNADETKKGTEANAAAASATVERLQKEKAAWIENLKMQIGAKQAAKDALAAEKEMQRMQEQIAAAVERIRAKVLKDEMDAIKHNRAEANRLFDEQAKGMQEYEKIVTEANNWSVSEHQKAINQIISSEAVKIAKMYEMWEAGTINIAQLNEGLAAVRGATAIATEAQHTKELADQVNFYASVLGLEEEYRAKKLEMIERERLANIAAGISAADAAKKAAQDIAKVNQDLFVAKSKQVHDAAGDMAAAFSAIGSMYDKNSGEYARMQEAAKAMIVLQQAVAVANAVAAIANQGLGDPYTAFARIAAMAAAMGTLLANIGGSISGGGAAAVVALPPSTVLGAAAGTGSESIGKVAKLLEDTYNLEYRELTGIHDSMKELNQNITGLVTSIVRTGGVGAFASAGGASTGLLENIAGEYAKGFVNLFTLGVFGGLADKIGGFVGGIVGSIFGGGTSSSLTGAGIEFRGITAGQLIAGQYMNALQYSVIKTVKDGGWFHSDKTYYQTIYKALDKSVSDLFTQVFQGMSTTLLEIAKGLGTDVNAVLNYSFKGEQLNLTGKTSDEINKIVSEYISKVGDVAVEALFGNIVLQYQKLNEGLFETAARLVVDKAVVNEILAMTNQRFPGATAAVIAFSEAIIEMAGGLDELQKMSATYYDKFFTDAEKQARLQMQLSGALGDMGYALPDARQGYRDLVEGLNLNTTAGQQAYVTLLSLSEAADKYYSALEDVGGAQSDLTKALKDQSVMIKNWIADLSRSSLAPVQSMEGWRLEYERQKAMAYAPGATTQDVSGFLNYAKDYLQFMRTYGGDYQALYESVVGDAQNLADVKDAQITAIEAADAAARINADRIVAAITTGRDIGGPNPPVRAYAWGGLTSGPSLAGEAGREWVVPTYEPQRSRFLESAPPQFWENLRGAGVVQPGGGGGPDTLNINLIVDGKVLARSQVKNLKSDGALAEASRRMN